MRKTILLVAAAGFLCAGSAQATVIWQDDYESYADTAALSGPYTQIHTSPLPLDTAKGYLSSQSIKAGPNANSEQRMYIDLPGGSIAGTDAMPIKFEFMVDIEEVLWHTREYIELRSYADGAYGQGGLQDIIAMGFTSSGVDTAVANYRILSGPDAGWHNYTSTEATRSAMAAADWTKLTALIKTDTIEFYVNDVLDTTKARNPNWQYDSLVLASGLSTAVPVWFDNVSVEVIPEPASLMLLGLGGLFLARRRRTA